MQESNPTATHFNETVTTTQTDPSMFDEAPTWESQRRLKQVRGELKARKAHLKSAIALHDQLSAYRKARKVRNKAARKARRVNRRTRS